MPGDARGRLKPAVARQSLDHDSTFGTLSALSSSKFSPPSYIPTTKVAPFMKWRVTAGELAEITGVKENTIRRLAGELREMLREVEIELER